jgi:DNA-binding XRE family transcriptional regulator
LPITFPLFRQFDPRRAHRDHWAHSRTWAIATHKGVPLELRHYQIRRLLAAARATLEAAERVLGADADDALQSIVLESIMLRRQRRLAVRIRALRKARKMTQAALARRARVSLGYVAHLETGHFDPRLSSLQKLAKALGVPVTELLE